MIAGGDLSRVSKGGEGDVSHTDIVERMRVRCSEIACGLLRSVHRATSTSLVQSSCPVLGQGSEDRGRGTATGWSQDALRTRVVDG